MMVHLWNNKVHPAVPRLPVTLMIPFRIDREALRANSVGLDSGLGTRKAGFGYRSW